MMEENNVLVREVFRLNGAVLELTDKHNGLASQCSDDIAKLYVMQAKNAKADRKTTRALSIALIGLSAIVILQHNRINKIEEKIEKG